jgi:trehalose/maltose transport system substrate-binding protein
MIQNHRGAFGTFNPNTGQMGTGYNRVYTYDQRLRLGTAPPFFLTTGLDGVRSVIAFSLGQREGSAVRGRFDVIPLPQGAAGSAAALGGWQLAVSRHSRFPQQAVELVRFMTNAEAQEFRAIRGAYNPTRRSVYQDPDILAANPFLARMPVILMAAVARSSTVTAAAYDSVSTAFQTEVYRVLQGVVSPEVALLALEQQLTRLRGETW